jgi:predicted nucleic acid-binding protein
VILADTGPLVALFNPRDADHQGTRDLLATLKNPLITTTPVLTSAFHLLDPGSRAAAALGEFVMARGLGVWFMDSSSMARALELMQKYADHPMDFADASLVTAGEVLRVTTVFTLDRKDFSSYRARIGRAQKRFRILDPARM